MRPTLPAFAVLCSSIALSTAAAQDVAAVFEYDVVPSFRGADSAQYAGWDAFTVPFGGVNLPDDSATDLTSSLEQTTPGAIITSTMNIYSPAAVPAFVVAASAVDPVVEAVIQVRTFGNPLDGSTFRLTYLQGGSMMELSPQSSEVLNPTPGFAEETLYRFSLASVQVDVLDFQIRFEGSDSNCSIDAVMLDTASDSPIGTAYCSANVNSTGAPGVLEAAGSVVAADNVLELRASSLPPAVFGLYITSTVQGNVSMPGGSQGILCLGGEIGRFTPEIFQSDAAGANATVIDLTQLPTPTGLVAAAAGETWNFQCWHRDAGSTPTSNFTSPVSITFQ
jgi:hypothetical protein